MLNLLVLIMKNWLNVRFFELVEVTLGDIFIFNALVETIVVLVFYSLHFFCMENITNVLGRSREQAMSKACQTII
jgi:hypothetical protein